MGNLNPGIRRRAADYLLEKETNVPAIVHYAEEKGSILPSWARKLHWRWAWWTSSLTGIPSASPMKDAARLEFDKGWTGRSWPGTI